MKAIWLIILLSGSAYAGFGIEPNKFTPRTIEAKFGKGKYLVKFHERKLYEKEFGRHLKWFKYSRYKAEIIVTFYKSKAVCIIYTGTLSKPFIDFIGLNVNDDIIMKTLPNRVKIFWTKQSKKLLTKNIKRKKL